MKNEFLAALVWAGGMIAIALGMSWAQKAGMVDKETVTRVVVGLNGLLIAWYGNRMPKALAPSAQARQVGRVGGWSMFLSGLIYAGVWGFAPIPVAVAVGCTAVLVGMAITLAYCFSLRSKARNSRSV